MINNFEDFKRDVLDCYPQEACGVVVDGVYAPIVNEHPDPTNNFAFPEEVSEFFAMHYIDGLKYKIVHSHTMERFTVDPRTPSYEDMKGQAATLAEWGIVHCDGENVTDMLWFGWPKDKEYLKRPYISNVYDCFTLARDFYYKEFNIDLGLHPRPSDWELWNPHYIENNYESLGFETVCACAGMQKGDILLYTINSRYINHIGIFLEQDSFLHQLHDRCSCMDSMNKWKRQLTKILRYSNGT